MLQENDMRIQEVSSALLQKLMHIVYCIADLGRRREILHLYLLII